METIGVFALGIGCSLCEERPAAVQESGKDFHVFASYPFKSSFLYNQLRVGIDGKLVALVVSSGEARHLLVEDERSGSLF